MNRPPSQTTAHPADPQPARTPGEVTCWVDAFARGKTGAFDELMPLVYRDLQVLARRQLRRASRGQTLDTSALVHELYLKMSKQKQLPANDREHFLLIASRAMRQVVVSHARHRAAQKRGQAEHHTTLEDHHASRAELDHVLDVDAALEALGQKRPRLRQVVECRFFAGLSEEETAEALGVSVRTVQRDWLRARLWLEESLEGRGENPTVH